MSLESPDRAAFAAPIDDRQQFVTSIEVSPRCEPSMPRQDQPRDQPGDEMVEFLARANIHVNRYIARPIWDLLITLTRDGLPEYWPGQDPRDNPALTAREAVDFIAEQARQVARVLVSYSSPVNEADEAEGHYLEWLMIAAGFGDAEVGSGVRRQILERFGHRCLRCCSTEDIAIDHIVPRSRGGRSSPDNLQTLCRSCNSRKGTRIIDYRLRGMGVLNDL